MAYCFIVLRQDIGNWYLKPNKPIPYVPLPLPLVFCCRLHRTAISEHMKRLKIVWSVVFFLIFEPHFPIHKLQPLTHHKSPLLNFKKKYTQITKEGLIINKIQILIDIVNLHVHTYTTQKTGDFLPPLISHDTPINYECRNENTKLR